MSPDQEDVEEMLSKWRDLDDLTVAGLHVLRDVVERAIEERTKDADYQVRVPLPQSPACKLCWSCQTWINPGEVCVRQASGKTYHKLCKP